MCTSINQIPFVSSSSRFSCKIVFVQQKLLKSQDVHNCKPLKSAASEVITMPTGINVRMVSKLYFCKYNLFLALTGFLENCMGETTATEITGCAQM